MGVCFEYLGSEVSNGTHRIRIQCIIYCQISNISGTLAGNKIVDHSDVVGASPVGAAPTTSSLDWGKAIARRDEKHLSFGIWCGLY